MISLYTWHAAPRQSELGAAALAVFQSLTRAFTDDRHVRVCLLDKALTKTAAEAVGRRSST